jgi:hypothetical protein
MSLFRPYEMSSSGPAPAPSSTPVAVAARPGPEADAGLDRASPSPPPSMVSHKSAFTRIAVKTGGDVVVAGAQH